MSEINDPVLVIGASGFVGRHLARQLLADGDGHAVRCLARDTTRVQDLADAGGEVVQGDILDPAAVQRAVQSVRATYLCIHTLSPQSGNAAGRDFMDVEQTGLANVVSASRAAGVCRLVYLTSIGVAPDARSAWVRGRWHTEQLLFSSGLDVTVIRPGMIVGPGGTGFDAITRGATGPVAIALGSGQQKTRPIAEEDLAYYLVGVLDDPRTFGRHYDVGSDDVLTTDQMLGIAAAVLGRRRPVMIHVPSGLLSLFSPLIERVTRLPRGSMKGLADSLHTDMGGDPTPIRSILDRTPLTYREAVQRALHC